MKSTLISLIVLGGLFYSCNQTKLTRDEIVKNNIYEKIKVNLNDPSKFEVVEFMIYDSITYGGFIKRYHDKVFSDFLWDTIELNNQIKWKKESSGMYNLKDYNRYKSDVEFGLKRMSLMDSVKKSMGPKADSIAAYYFGLRFRGSNSLGALVLNNLFIMTGPEPEYPILFMDDEMENVMKKSIDFPGKELVVPTWEP